MAVLSLSVNGKPVSAEVEPRCLLSQLLREHLGLTGAHVGCDTSQCGACVVHVDGKAIKSCTMLAAQAEGCEVTTIEGLTGEGVAGEGKLHPMQEAFRDHHGLQCGFCTPGMIMASVALARDNPALDEEAVRKGLEGNLCRCTGYQNIIRAVVAGARAMRG
ncbi:MAG: (2Fe-2S)-binding protein [Methyloligellaceae bacterium]